MPTNHDETLHERYAREHEAELAMLAKMTPEEIHGLCLQLHNALAERDALRAELAEVKGREALAGLLAIVDDSRGVAGYHLNGAIADWDEFPEVESARAMLAAAPKESTHD